MIRIIFIDNLVCLKAFVFICVTPVFGLVLHYIMKNIGSPMDKLIQNENLNIFGQAGWNIQYQITRPFLLSRPFSLIFYFPVICTFSLHERQRCIVGSIGKILLLCICICLCTLYFCICIWFIVGSISWSPDRGLAAIPSMRPEGNTERPI